METNLDLSPITLHGSTWLVEKDPNKPRFLIASWGDLCVHVERFDRNSNLMAVTFFKGTLLYDEFLPEEWTTLEVVAATLRGRLIPRRVF